MSLVVVGHGAEAALLHRQTGLGAIERLDLRLFVEREHDSMGRRVDVEADDALALGGALRVVRQLEAAEAVRRPTVQIGRAAGRAHLCKSVAISVGPVSL